MAEHPASMTHAGMELDEKLAMGITDNLVRLSIGVEDPKDLIEDLRKSLKFIKICFK